MLLNMCPQLYGCVLWSAAIIVNMKFYAVQATPTTWRRPIQVQVSK